MRPSELEGKKVVDTGAKIVGTVSNLEFDWVSWRITDLIVELTSSTAESLGYKKHILGRTEILIPVEMVEAVADVVRLNKPAQDLRNFVQPSKQET